MPGVLPSGLVTFAFVDVVGSTRAFAEHGEAFVSALGVVHDVVAACTERHGGTVVKTEGDGAFLAFHSADAAVRAAVAVQERLASWPEQVSPRLRIRAGLHAGPARPVAGDYIALAVNVAARVCSAAGAGQVLASAAVVDALEDPGLRELAGERVGEYALKDVVGPSALWRLHGDDAAPSAPLFRRTNVAEATTSFVGRADELVEVRDLLAAHRVVSVVGPGGMGKTRLVSELALSAQHDFPGGVWLAELAGVARPEDIVPRVAAMLPGAQGARTTEELAEAVAAVAAGRPLVVVLDNCEHVLDAAAEVAVALTQAPGAVQVLTTSREALRVPGERVWRLPPLSAEQTQRRLFQERAAAVGVSVPPDDAAVVELCRHLDGLPLAIELAASQVADVPPGTLLDIVVSGEDALGRRGPGRQSSLDSIVAWSLDRLAIDRRESLLALSLPSGRLEPDWARAIVASTLGAGPAHADQVLRDLVRASLVDLDGGQYRLLDTIRAAGRRRLRSDPALLERARAAVHSVAEELAASYLDGPGIDVQVLGTPELMALWEDALLDAGPEPPPGLGHTWVMTGMLSTAHAPSERLLVLSEEMARAIDLESPLTEDAAMMLAAAVNLADQRGRPSPVEIACLDRAVEQARHLRPEARWFAVWAGTQARIVPQVSTGLDDLVDQLGEIAEESGRSRHRQMFWHGATFARAMAGDVEGSLVAAERAVAICLSEGGAGGATSMMVNVAWNLINLERPAEALPWLWQALERRPRGTPRWRCLVELARAYRDLGRLEDARTTLEELESELGPPETADAFKRALWEEVRKAFPEGTGAEVPREGPAVTASEPPASRGSG